MTIPLPALTKGNILIVDDVPDNLIFLNKMLSAQGYKVRSAPSGHLAIQSVFAKPPDLILLDILMPEMNGYEVCQYLKSQEQTFHIPIIFVSALSETLDKVKAFSIGGSDYLTKPVEITEAIARIEHQLNLSRLQQELLDRNHLLEQEISSRKQAEAALQQAMRELTDIKFALDQSAIVAITDAQGRITYANDQFCGISKFLRQELLGQTHQIINSGYHPKDFFRYIWATISSGKVWKGEVRNRAKDGSIYWVDTVIVPMLGNDGKPHQYVAICQDISDRGSATLDKIRAALATWERSQAEEKVRLLQSVVVNANDAVVITEAGPFDEPGPKILYVNEAFTQMTGYQSGEILGKTPRILQGPKTSPEMRTKIRTALQAWQPFRGELLNYAKDGTEFWVDLSITPLVDENGWVTHWIAIQRDMSDRRQREEELQQINTALSHTVEGIARLDPQGQYRMVNQAYARIVGYWPEDMIGMKWTQTVHPDDCAQLSTVFKKLRSTGKVEVETRGLRKDGSIFDKQLTMVATYDQQNKLSGFFCFMKDISERVRHEAERKSAENELRKSEQKFRAIFETMSQFIGLLTPEGRIIEVNETALQLVDVKREEILGQLYWETPWWTHSPQQQKRLKAAIAQASKGEWIRFETEHIRADGITIFVDFSLKPILDESGKAVMLIPEGRDVSDRKRAEAEIINNLEKERELNEIKTRFVSMVSHEYRTPLSTILSSLELIEHYGHLSTQQEKQGYYQQIRVAIHRLTELLNDVLTLNKSEAGKIIFNPIPLDLKQFCQDLVAELQRNIVTNHRIHLSIQEQYSEIEMDERLLRHIFSNLISNAVKYSPNGGTIGFEIEFQDQTSTFLIQDQGIGIPPESLQNLFDAFFRADNVGNIAGTGLGLSIVKRLVEAHRGSISVKSQLEAGTTFIVRLPLNTKNLNSFIVEK